MTAYIIRRLLFMIPTMLEIMLVAFVVTQFAPGGPVEQVIAKLSGADTGATSRISGSPGGDLGARGMAPGAAQGDAANSKYRGAQGLDPEFIKKLEKQFGFDKPEYERFGVMLWSYIRFDFGKSYFRDISVLQLIKEKLPVSMSLGIWMTLLTYLISIPLGIRKAVDEGSRFDMWTLSVIIVGYAIPGFLFAILLIILFAGGSFFGLRSPCAELVSENFWSPCPWWTARSLDYFWHLTLPIIAMALSRLRHHDAADQELVPRRDPASSTCSPRAPRAARRSQALYGHVFRNAMLIVVAGFPGAFVSRLLRRLAA